MPARRATRRHRVSNTDEDRTASAGLLGPQRIAELLESDEAFQVTTVDGLNWIDPFSGTLVSAPFDFREVAHSWLLDNRPWRKHPEPTPIDQLRIYRWKVYLRNNMKDEARLRHFLPDGRWLNPFTGEWVSGIPREGNKISRETVRKLATHLSRCPEAQEARLLDAAELASISRSAKAKLAPKQVTPEPGKQEPSKPAPIGQRHVQRDRNATPAAPIPADGDATYFPGHEDSAEIEGFIDASPSAGHTVRPNELVVGYQILSPLGSGGAGAVYRAVQLSMNREVALKVLKRHEDHDHAFKERFLREARAAGQINHPNVVTVYDVGQHSGRLYMSMELVGDGDAETVARNAGGALSERQALTIIRDAAAGLHAIHEANIIHRDIKPSNLFVNADSVTKIGDLGMAKADHENVSITKTGAALGTPAFMAPEQARGEDEIDARVDIYALGATLYFLLTGGPPYTGRNVFTVLRQIINDPIPDVRDINAAVSEATATLIRKALSKRPQDRQQTALELRADIEAALKECPDLAPLHQQESHHSTKTIREKLATNRYQRPGARTHKRSPSQALMRKDSIEASLAKAGLEVATYTAHIKGNDLYALRRWSDSHALLVLLSINDVTDEDIAHVDDALDEIDPISNRAANQVLERLHAHVTPHLQRDFAAAAITIDLLGGTINLAYAGMAPALTCNPHEQMLSLRSLGTANERLGSRNSVEIGNIRTALEPGACLVLTTPGVQNTMDADGNPYTRRTFGADLLRLADLPPDALAESLSAQLDAFSGGDLKQDATFLVIHRGAV